MPRPSEPATGRSLALIIATSSYADPMLSELRAPGQDAADLGEVLGDEAIGGYDITKVINQPADAIRRAIARFCASGGRHDLALIYLSCHGILDDHGHLHYAAADTERSLLAATSIEAAWLNRQLEVNCACNRQLLILDCCHSGAFARGARGETAVALQDHFPLTRGRVVLTASRATEYAFEGDKVTGDGAAGVFTSALVDGLRDGKADRDGDGLISVTELYEHAAHHVGEHDRRQRPGISVFGGEGKLVVARNPRGPRIALVPLPVEVVELINDGRPGARIGAVALLAELLVGENAGLALTAREELERIAERDVPQVAERARRALELRPAPPEGGPDEDESKADRVPASLFSRLRAGIVRRPVIAIAGLLALLALVAVVVLPGGDHPAVVHIGAIYPLASGANSGAAEDIVAGESLLVDYLNNGRDYGELNLPLPAGKGLPALKGAKLKLDLPEPKLNATDRCNVQAAFKQLVDTDHVVGVLGAYESTLTLQAIDAAEVFQVPLVNEGSTLWSLTYPDQRSGKPHKGCSGTVPDHTPSPWFFRVGPSDTRAAMGYFPTVINLLSGVPISKLKVVIVHEGHDAFGNGAATITKMVAEGAGVPAGNITTLSYPTALGLPVPASNSPCTPAELTLVKNLQGVVANLKRLSPDVVIAASYAPDALALVQTMEFLKYKRPLMLTYGTAFLGDAFTTNVRAGGPCGLPAANPDGIITRASWAPPNVIANPSLNARVIAADFLRHYGRAMTSDAAIGFTAALTLATAINKAGPSPTPARIRQALATLKIPADQTIMFPWTGVRFDPNGQNTQAQVVLQQIGAASAPAVYPTNVAALP